MHRSVAILQGESCLPKCLVGKQVVNVLLVQLEELRLRKQCVFWAPGKFRPIRVGHQVAERAFVVVVPRHGPVLLDCNRIVLGCCDRDMVGSDPPRCGIAILSALTLCRCTLAIVDRGLLHDSFSMGIICVKLGILALFHFSQLHFCQFRAN